MLSNLSQVVLRVLDKPNGTDFVSVILLAVQNPNAQNVPRYFRLSLQLCEI